MPTTTLRNSPNFPPLLLMSIVTNLVTSHIGKFHQTSKIRYTTAMNVLLLILILLKTATINGIPALRVPDDRMSDGQEEFVLQLRQRGFYELAQHYCDTQQSLTSNPDECTHWEILATDCDQDQAWQLERSQRIEKVSQTATQLTEFLRTHTPTPEYDLWLRLRQIELLNAAAQMEWSVLTIHQQALKAGSSIAATTTRPSASEQFALDACRQGQELAEAMLQQLDLHRRDLDADVLRTVRIRARFAIAELILAESGLSTGEHRGTLQQKVSDQAEQLLKSAGQNDRFRARRLQAHIKLEQHDFSAFELRMRSLQAEVRSDDERVAALALTMQARLLQRQPSQAIELIVPDEKASWRDAPVIQVLKLEALLQLCEVLLDLQDATEQRQQALLRTASEFRQLHERLQAQLRGVWRQRIQSCFQRFELVLKVGATGATALEEISLLISSGDLKAARQALLALTDRSTSDPSLTAFALLQSGDLAARSADWSAAVSDLARAIELFREIQNPERESSADLLRIYCLGQISNASKESPPARENYLHAMNHHLQQFSGQPSVNTVLEYRARYFRNSEPLLAASDIRTLLNLTPQKQSPAEAKDTPDTPSSADKLQKLCLLADLLLEYQRLLHNAAQPESPMSQQLRDSLFQEFKRSAKASLQRLQKENALKESQILELLLLCEPLMNPDTRLSSSEWESHHSQLTQCLEQISSPTAGKAKNPAPPATSDADPRDPHSFEVISERAVLAAHATRVIASLHLLLPASDRTPSLEFPGNQSAIQQLFFIQLLEGKLSDMEMPQQASLAAILQQLRKSHTHPGDDVTAQLLTLKTTLQLAVASGQFNDAEIALQNLLRLPLSTEQIHQAATLVATFQVSTDGTKRLATPLRRDFWNRILKQSRSGQPAWLEASLQLAQLALESSNPTEAKRIIALVDVLYPEWGDPDRKTRAKSLQKSLEPSP